MIKKLIMAVFFLLSITSCTSTLMNVESDISNDTNNPLKMGCMYTGGTYSRCENEEVVCYRVYDKSTSCTFKESK